MAKKKGMIHKKAIGRSRRITERHQQPKRTEENVAQASGSGNGNPKCKLRDVKNNKKKNDKKELGRLLFAEVAVEKPKTEEKQNVAPAPPENNVTEENASSYIPQPVAEQPKQTISERIQNCFNKLNDFFYKPTAIKDLQNNNNLNVANNNVTEAKVPFTLNVVNFPDISGSENGGDVPNGGKMTYDDFINNSPLPFFKYMINTDAQNGGSFDIFSENDECVKTFGDILIYVRQENEKSAKNKKWPNEVFNQIELNIFKKVNDQFYKMLQTSFDLRGTKIDLNYLRNSDDTKAALELQKENIIEMMVQDENGFILKFENVDINAKINELITKTSELERLEAEVTRDLRRFVGELPGALRTRLYAAILINCENWCLMEENNVASASALNRNNEENNVASTSALNRNNEEHNVASTSALNRNNEEQNVASTSALNRNNEENNVASTSTLNGNNRRPLNLTRKQKRNRRRRFSRNMRSRNNVATPLNQNTDLEVLREDLNISNTTINLPDQVSNRTFDLESDNMPEPPAFTPSEEMKKLDNLEKLLIESNEILRNNISNGLTVPQIDAPPINIDAYLYDFEDSTRISMETEQILSVVHMVNERTDFKVLRFEKLVKKYLLGIKHQENVFKMHKKGSKKVEDSVVNFIRKNYPFIDEQDFEEDEEYDSPLSDYDSDMFEDTLEMDDSASVIERKIKNRRVKYENKFLDINIAAINKLIPNDPFNQNQYDEYNKNRMNLNVQFVDLFEMNSILKL